MILVELEITPGATRGAYAVAANSPAGASAGTVRLDVAALLGRRRELAASVLASAVTTRAGLSGLERPVREVGRALFEGVFAGRVYGRYTASVQEAARRGEPLRVVLRLRAPELAGLPWETLFDRRPGKYRCQREPVVRYVQTAQRRGSPLTGRPRDRTPDPAGPYTSRPAGSRRLHRPAAQSRARPAGWPAAPEGRPRRAGPRPALVVATGVVGVLATRNGPGDVRADAAWSAWVRSTAADWRTTAGPPAGRLLPAGTDGTAVRAVQACQPCRNAAAVAS